MRKVLPVSMLLLALLGQAGCGSREGGPSIPPRVAKVGEYYLTTWPRIVLWQGNAVTYAFVRVGTVYGSSDDFVDAEKFKPRLVSVTLDGRPLKLVKALPGENDKRSVGADNDYSDVSGWDARGLWAAPGNALAARRLAAVVCWPEGQGCARATFTRCDPYRLAGHGVIAQPTVEAGLTIPVGARVFYDHNGSAYDQCGAVSVARLR